MQYVGWSLDGGGYREGPQDDSQQESGDFRPLSTRVGI